MSQKTREACLRALREQAKALEDITIASIPFCMLAPLLNSTEGFNDLVSWYDENNVIYSLARLAPARFEFHQASIKSISAVEEIKLCVEEDQHHFRNDPASQKRTIAFHPRYYNLIWTSPKEVLLYQRH